MFSRSWRAIVACLLLVSVLSLVEIGTRSAGAATLPDSVSSCDLVDRGVGSGQVSYDLVDGPLSEVDYIVWRNGVAILRSGSTSRLDFNLLEGANYISISTERPETVSPDPSRRVYCDVITWDGDADNVVPNRVPSCSYIGAGGGEGYVLYVPADGREGEFEHLIWQNGRVIDRFEMYAGSDAGVIETSILHVLGANYVSMSTERIGDSPDPSRRTYCGSFTYVPEPNLIATCSHSGSVGDEGFVTFTPVAGPEDQFEYLVWQNGRVTSRFQESAGPDDAHVGFSITHQPGANYVSMSTEAIGDAPDPFRRTYCGNVIYAP